jgi:protein-disulfide isomerase
LCILLVIFLAVGKNLATGEQCKEDFEKRPIPRPDPNCQTKEVDENINLAKDLDIHGSPTTIFPDGSVQAGFLEADRLIERVNSLDIKKK